MFELAGFDFFFLIRARFAQEWTYRADGGGEFWQARRNHVAPGAEGEPQPKSPSRVLYHSCRSLWNGGAAPDRRVPLCGRDTALLCAVGAQSGQLDKEIPPSYVDSIEALLRAAADPNMQGGFG